jgi:hypothetical protein
MPRMRIAVAALLLLNVLLYGWAKLSDSRPAATISEPQLATLKLIPAKVLSPTRCMSLGPFGSNSELTTPAAALAGNGLKARNRQAEHAVSGGWWVYVNGLGSRFDRRRALARLRRAGVSEVAEISFAPGDERISAGIYSDHERAMFIAAKVITAQLKPTVEERTSSVSDWWLDTDIQREATLPVVSTLIAGTKVAQGLAWSECPPPSAGG